MEQSNERRILVVDDEAVVRDVVSRSLRKVGYDDITAVESAEAARGELSRNGPYSLVILDQRMPGEDGTVLLEELAPLAPRTVVVMATGIGDGRTAVKALRAGAYDYLIKPLIPEGVQLAVARALRRRRMEMDVLEHQQHIEQLVEERAQVIESTRRALLMALCQMAEFRDPETGAHLNRIPEYCRVLATDMAQNSPYADLLTPDYVARLVESSPLHDIGKVAVPDGLLLKPGPLLPEEFEVVKMHTVWGRDACLSVKKNLGPGQSDFIEMALDVAYTHHESWDGSGYPCGSVGEDIPLCGRIVRIADFYDACRSPRVYRPKPIPREEIVQAIAEGSGGAFGPEAAAAFKRLVDKFAEIETYYESQ